MRTMRAKFRVETVSFRGDPTNPDTPRNYKLYAVYDTSTKENARFTKATPYGELTMSVDNPAAHLEVGKEYYLDFTPCSDASALAEDQADSTPDQTADDGETVEDHSRDVPAADAAAGEAQPEPDAVHVPAHAHTDGPN